DEMACCVAVGCCNRSDRKDLSFYRFPKDPERRTLWVQAVCRRNWNPTDYSRICSKHFISGRYTSLRTEIISAATALLDLSGTGPNSGTVDDNGEDVDLYNEEVCQADLPGEEEEETGVEAQTDLSGADVDTLTSAVQKLTSEKQLLTDQLKIMDLSEESFKDNDEKTKVYTGLPTFVSFMTIMDLIMPCLRKPNSALSPFHKCLLTLMKLRLNVSMLYLSYVFRVHYSTVAKTFSDVITFLNIKLVPSTVFWPERDQIKSTMPQLFKATYPDCVSILDCFEVLTEGPSYLETKTINSSHYKSHNTMKYLISVTPQGFINFISKGWAGRTSDRLVTESCGYLNNLAPGDAVLANKGFNIEDIVALRGARLIVPVITKGVKQLPHGEITEGKKLLSVRINMDRALGNLMQKYPILRSTFPIKFLLTDQAVKMSTLDKIMRVTCGLCNICNSVRPCN
uniref:THAP-type domain-containing protein n=1 Tax=Xiphophorus couchianus TaxID=32473 RepID=A0A3B5MKN2_9TELE